MSLRNLKLLVFFVARLATVSGTLEAQSPNSGSAAAGHWEGEIQLPTTSLGVRVDLDRDAAGAWSGTIDIPVQGLRGLKLSDLSVKGPALSFGMPGIPGTPKFAGELDKSAAKITGTFSQNGQTFPFKLERKTKVTVAGETPSRGAPGKGLAGYWQGSLKATAVLELRLVLEL